MRVSFMTTPPFRLHRWLGPAALVAAGCVSLSPLPQYPAGPLAGVPPSTIQQVAHTEPELAPTTPAAPLPAVVTLPDAIQECMYANLRLRAKGEKVPQAMADLTTAGLIPNISLFAQYQLVPLQHTDMNNQAGPPQWDGLFTIPLDWFLFGKRVAAIEAARLNVDVASFDLADVVRTTVQQTIESFYDHLEAKALSQLAQDDLADFKRIEEIIKKQVAAGGAGQMEADRARLAVLDAQREAYLRELTVATTKAKLRPLLGRTASDPDFEVRGTLTVTKAVTPPPLAEMIALAERNRPDLLSDQVSIQQSRAALYSEQRKAKPQMSLQSGLSAQVQRRITGFPDATLFDINLTTSLPITDRNQGNIAKAQSVINQNVWTLQADTADVRAEVERTVREYGNAFARVTRDDPAALATAKSLRDATEKAVQAGGRKLLDLLDAQRAYRDRLKATVSNQADYWRSLNRLNAATGVRAGDQ
jgi:cobalt-zinc-cadmium efflux system outer membrane protein